MATATLLAASVDDHLATLRSTYRDALLGGLAAALPPGSRWNEPDGGMLVWARLPDGHDAAELLTAALRHDVAFVPGAPFYTGQADLARYLERTKTTEIRHPRHR